MIVGTGAMGSLFAARLAGAGHDVTMLGTWKEGLESIRSDGVRFVDTGGREHRLAIHATDDPRECAGARYALVLVKAWQTERAARQLAECLAPDGLAVTLQNGLGNREALIQSLGPGRVALGVTTTGATLLGPGQVKAGGEGLLSIERNPSLGPLEEALKSANFNIQIVDDVRSLIWGKLVINSAINPLTALLRVPNGELLERPSARELMRTLAQETAQVAQCGKHRPAFPRSGRRRRGRGPQDGNEPLLHAAGCAARSSSPKSTRSAAPSYKLPKNTTSLLPPIGPAGSWSRHSTLLGE